MTRRLRGIKMIKDFEDVDSDNFFKIASFTDLSGHSLKLYSSEGNKLGINFNCKKSHYMIIGPQYTVNASPMDINGMSLSWVNKLSYLGVVILSGKTFDVDISCVRRKFFSAVNSILKRSSKCTDVKLHLCEAHCLPILLYASECFDVTITRKRGVNSWRNSVYRKIFGYHKWESVRQLICLLERLDFLSLLAFRKFCFTKM